MDIKPIVIDVVNGDLYARLAYFLDQPKVYERIILIRKCWHLDKGLVSSRNYNEWRNGYLPNLKYTPEATNYLYQAKEKIGEESISIVEQHNLTKKIANLSQTDFEIEVLLLSTGFATSYKEIALKAVACGEINQQDLDRKINNLEYEELITDQKLSWIIKKNYKNKGRLKSKIRRDRLWYWEWLSQKRDMGVYSRILENWNKKCPTPEIDDCGHCINDNNIIEQAIHRYREFLQS